VWMATKGFIRDFTTVYASHMKKVRNLRIKELEEKCLEMALKRNYSNTVSDELQVVRQKLNDLLRKTERNSSYTGPGKITIVMEVSPADFWLLN